MKHRLDSLVAQVEKIQEPKPRTHYLWLEPGEDTTVKARDMIARGLAREPDTFVGFSWGSSSEHAESHEPGSNEPG